MKIKEIRRQYLEGQISKPDYIRGMYERHHAQLFDYANHLSETNVAKIEISDGKVIMTSRDHQVKLICPPGDFRVVPLETLNFLEYEPSDFRMMMHLTSGARCVLDVGANMGWYAINIAKVHPACTVHAFEPIPATFNMLTSNIELNHLANVIPHNFGLSDADKDLTFFFYPEGSGNASSANLSEREDAQQIDCHVKTMDEIAVLYNLPQVDFIKCDVEGAELMAIKGGINLITKSKPIIFCEMLRKWSAKFGYHPNEIIELLNRLDYKCYTAENEKLNEFQTMDDNTIATNFFFLHVQKHAALIAGFVTA